MTTSSDILSNLKTAICNLEEVRAKIEQFQAPESGDRKRQSDLHSYEDLLTAQLVTIAMRYHCVAAYEWQTKVGRGSPDPASWIKRAALVLSNLTS